jgi:hypothetical protein
MIQTAAVGTALSEVLPEERRLPLWERAGEMLKQIHTILISGFGELVVNDGALHGQFPTAAGWIERRLIGLDYITEHNFVTTQQHEKQAFNRGYGDMALDPLVSKYALFVAVGKVAYRHRRGFDHRMPRAIENLARSMKTLGI